MGVVKALDLLVVRGQACTHRSSQPPPAAHHQAACLDRRAPRRTGSDDPPRQDSRKTLRLTSNRATRIESGPAKERSLPARTCCRSGESRGPHAHKVGDDGSRCDQSTKCEQYVTTLCGMGKTHLATALGYAACQHGYSVLFANAIDAINTLT